MQVIKDMYNNGRLQELLQLKPLYIIRLFAIDHLMQDDMYIKSSFTAAVASCYTCYRGGCLMQTVSVQFNWESVRTIGLRPLY